MEKKSKTKSQIKYLKNTVERFPLDLEIGKKERFKKTCKERGTSAMAELRNFVDNYLEKYEKKFPKKY